MPYCTTDEVREVGTQITEAAEPTAWTDEVLEKVIERASRIIDLECGVDPEFFEPAGVSATNKTVVGDGTNYLRLPPYVAGTLNATLTYPDGYDALQFTERGGYLVRTESGMLLSHGFGGWYENVPITVSARWGYDGTPADINHATIELVINLVKEVDPASIKMMSLEGQPLREKLPPRVANICNKYRYKGAVLV